MSIGWIILGIFALGVLGLWAIFFFKDLQEASTNWSWPKVLIISIIITVVIIYIGTYFGFY